MLLGSSCAGCGRPGPVVCPACGAALRAPPPRPPPPGLASCAAVLRYDDASRRLVAGVKYRNARQVVGRLAGALAAIVEPAVADGRIVAITWAPTTPEHRRERGFDHARLLARALAARVDRPCPALLRRDAGAPQTGRARGDRWLGPAFRAIGPSAPADAPVGGAPLAAGVLVVDDVITTGATLAAAARALHAAGWPEVHGAAAARRP